MILIAGGKRNCSKKAMGIMINLLTNEPLVIDHNTGISREDKNPVAFSAFTAKSSPNIPAVCLVAIFEATATSSIRAAISSKIAKNPEALL